MGEDFVDVVVIVDRLIVVGFLVDVMLLWISFSGWMRFDDLFVEECNWVDLIVLVVVYCDFCFVNVDFKRLVIDW